MHGQQNIKTGYQFPSNTTIYLVILTVMATCVRPSDHHLAILQTEGPKHVAITTRITKYIVVFGGN